MPQTIKIVEQRTGGSLATRMLESIRSYTIGPMSLRDPALAKFFGLGRSTASGITVTDEMAFTCSAVMSAVSGISADVANKPLKLLKRRQDGGNDDFIESKTYSLLKDEPNPDMSSFIFRQTLTAHALTCHGGFAEIERDGVGRPSALWPITPDRIKPFIDKEKLANGAYRSRLRYRVDGETILESGDVIHLRGLGYDGYRAYPLIDKARQAIGLALAAEKFGATFFGNGSTFGGVFATDQAIGPDKEKELRESIEAYNSGPDKQHRNLFLSGGWKYTQIGVAPNEAQMNELRDKQNEEVARFFHYPLHRLMVNRAGAVSYASTSEANLDYYTSCLLNWFVNWEQELTRKLIAPLERRQQSIKHNVTASLRGDPAARTALYTAMLDRGVFNADMVLELEDMNPQPDGQGKLYLVQGAMVPKDRISDIAQAQIDKASQPPPEPAKAKSDQNQPTSDPNPNARALEDAIGRATLAEAAAAEALRDAQVQREARAALEATGVAQAEEIARRVESERVAFANAAELEVIAAQLRADVERERMAHEEDIASLDRLRAEVVSAEARVASLSSDIEARVLEMGAAASALESARAELADVRLVADARHAELEALRSAERVAAELLAARDAELAESRTALEALEKSARQMMQEAAAARAEAEEARIAAEAVASGEAAARAEADRLFDLAEARAQAATAEALTSSRLVEESRAALQVAQDAHGLAVAALTQAELDAQDKAAEIERLQAAAATQAIEAERVRAESQRRLDEAGEALRIATEARAQAEEQRRQAETAAEVVTGQIEAIRGEAAAQVAAAEADKRASLEVAEETRQARRLAEEAQRAALLRQREADDAARAAQERADALAVCLREMEAAERARLTRVITAHRLSVVDVMQRMIEREIDRAHRAQGDPEKAMPAMTKFYEGHEALVVSALLPSIRTHLAFSASEEDPEVFTRKMARQHVQDSLRQLAVVFSEERDAVPAALAAVFQRWRTDRIEHVADLIVRRDIDVLLQGSAAPPQERQMLIGEAMTRTQKTVKRDAQGRIAEIIEDRELSPGGPTQRIRKIIERGEDDRITGIREVPE